MHDDVISDAHPSFRPLGRMPIFRPGKSAYLHGREVRVTYVHIRKGELLVHLEGHADAVPHNHLEMEPSELVWPAGRLEAHMGKTKLRTPAPEPAKAPSDEPSADDIFAQAMAATPAHSTSEGESTDDIFAQAAALPSPAEK